LPALAIHFDAELHPARRRQPSVLGLERGLNLQGTIHGVDRRAELSQTLSPAELTKAAVASFFNAVAYCRLPNLRLSIGDDHARQHRKVTCIESYQAVPAGQGSGGDHRVNQPGTVTSAIVPPKESGLDGDITIDLHRFEQAFQSGQCVKLGAVSYTHI
jgi:hypothetical protein